MRRRVGFALISVLALATVARLYFTRASADHEATTTPSQISSSTLPHSSVSPAVSALPTLENRIATTTSNAHADNETDSSLSASVEPSFNRSQDQVARLPMDMEAELKSTFDLYDSRLDEPNTNPTWWGNRNIQNDLAVLDSSANVARTHCVEVMCIVDVDFRSAHDNTDFDGALHSLPTLQTGVLIRHFADNPRRIRLYIHNVSMKDVPIIQDYSFAARAAANGK